MFLVATPQQKGTYGESSEGCMWAIGTNQDAADFEDLCVKHVAMDVSFKEPEDSSNELICAFLR